MGIKASLLSLLGLAHAKRLLDAQSEVTNVTMRLDASSERVKELQAQLATAKAEVSSAQKKNALLKEEARRSQALRTWCTPALASFPVSTPVNLYTNTRKLLATFMRASNSFFDLMQRRKFGNAEQWALYWCIAHASSVVARAAQAAKNEDGISRDFLEELRSQAGKLSLTTGEETSLQIAYNAIFDQNKPAMKEAAVGADILLIIAGDAMFPNGFARILWIQAKNAAPKDPFTLDYSRRNTKGYQVDALSRVHEPANGSLGLYAQYAAGLRYIPAVFVDKLIPHTKNYSADLSDIGSRLSELVVACMSNHRGLGAFANTNALLAYLNKVSDMKPLFIVTITPDRDISRQPRNNNQLLSTVSAFYEKLLGMERDQEPDPDPDPDLDPDDGPDYKP